MAAKSSVKKKTVRRRPPRFEHNPNIGPLGAHVSSAGGSHNTGPRAVDIGADAVQLFTKTPNQWREPKMDEAACTLFCAAMTTANVAYTTAHDSYLINLASPDVTLRARSLESFTNELRRAEALKLHGLVSHPGNYMDDRDSGIARNADAITEALEAVPGSVRLLLETTAGTGTALGATFEEIAAIRKRIPSRLRARVGVCVDTCHVHSAGYDLVNDFDGVWSRFDDVLGFELLGVLHLNDSKTPFNSHRDRHEEIGKGSLGEMPFRRLMTHERLAMIPKVIETPKGKDLITNDRRALRLLRRFATEG